MQLVTTSTSVPDGSCGLCMHVHIHNCNYVYMCIALKHYSEQKNF